MMSLRAAVVAAAFLLFGCAGILGVYLGVMSQAELLRPRVPTDAPGGPQHRSVMALDSARAPTAAPQHQAVAPPAAQPSDTARVAPSTASAPSGPPTAPAQDSHATAEPPPTVV